MVSQLCRLIPALAVSIVVGCHPKPGTPCDPQHPGQCKGRDEAFFCIEGRWEWYPCRGPGGCETNHTTQFVSCDMRRALDGDPCSPDVEELWSCDLDDPAYMLQCLDGTFERNWECEEGTVCTSRRGYIDCRPPPD